MSSPARWRIAHLHLDQPLEALGAVPGVAGYFLVWWWRDIPLGLGVVRASELPLSAPALSELGTRNSAPAVRRYLEFHRAGELVAGGTIRPLALLCDLLAERCAQTQALSASVVICTRDRPELLARCLGSLATMLGPADEVLVVDNASRSAATQEVARAHPFVRYVHEPTPGLDVARNTGVRASKGEIVAFCDDDVSVGPAWLSRIKAAFLEDEVMAATGPLLAASLDTEAEYLFETRWGFNRGFAVRTFGPEYFAANRVRGVPVWEIGAGANMAFRRSVFAAVGGFDERLDVGAAGCSGDSEMWYRILAAGFRCRYEPSAISFHQHRQDLEALRSQIFHYMRGHAAALLIQFERTGHWGNIRRLLFGLPLNYVRRCLRRALRRDRGRDAMLGTEIRGWASGIVYYQREARQAPPVVVAAAHGATGADLQSRPTESQA